jgi:hypothetical protein
MRHESLIKFLGTQPNRATLVLKLPTNLSKAAIRVGDEVLVI